MRESYIWDKVKQELVPKAEYYARQLTRGHAVITDSIDITSPIDGRQYTSKSAYYRSVRQAGCEIVGNETQKRGEWKSIESPGRELARRIKGY